MSTIDDAPSTSSAGSGVGSGAEAPADSIAGFLGADHQRIAKLWSTTLSAFERSDFNAMHERTAEFIAAMRRHLRMEEQILFAAIEEKTGQSKTGQTHAMRLEHREIERVLHGLTPLLTVQERWTAIQAIEGGLTDPSALFRSHDVKEETVLYPMADRLLGAQSARKLIERMRTEVDSPSAIAAG